MNTNEVLTERRWRVRCGAKLGGGDEQRANPRSLLRGGGGQTECETIRSSAGSLLLRSFCEGRLSVKWSDWPSAPGRDGEPHAAAPPSELREVTRGAFTRPGTLPASEIRPKQLRVEDPRAKSSTQPFPRCIQITRIKPPFSLPPFIFH